MLVSKKFILTLLSLVLLLVACAPSQESNQIVCNKPYILVGSSCCLDKDDNLVCDSDEVKEMSESVSQAESAPSSKEISISDVQSGINKVLSAKIFDFAILTKSQSNNHYDFYTDVVTPLTIIAKESSSSFNSFATSMEKFGVTVFVIKSEDKYITDEKSFLEFVTSQKSTLTSYLGKRTQLLNEYISDGGKIPESIEIRRGLRDLHLVNSTFERNEIMDEFGVLPVVSNRLIEISKTYLEDFDLEYKGSGSGLIKTTAFSIDYIQAYSIWCSPNLVITIYANPYPSDKSLEEASVKNYVNKMEGKMLMEAQAVIELCEQRNDFTYFRN